MTALTQAATFAYLVLGTSPDLAISQSVHATRYGSMGECMRALSSIVLSDTTAKPVLVTFKPFCTDIRPEWWIEVTPPGAAAPPARARRPRT